MVMQLGWEVGAGFKKGSFSQPRHVLESFDPHELLVALKKWGRGFVLREYLHWIVNHGRQRGEQVSVGHKPLHSYRFVNDHESTFSPDQNSVTPPRLALGFHIQTSRTLIDGAHTKGKDSGCRKQLVHSLQDHWSRDKRGHTLPRSRLS
jgi:hypothetical protein